MVVRTAESDNTMTTINWLHSWSRTRPLYCAKLDSDGIIWVGWWLYWPIQTYLEKRRNSIDGQGNDKQFRVVSSSKTPNIKGTFTHAMINIKSVLPKGSPVKKPSRQKWEVKSAEIDWRSKIFLTKASILKKDENVYQLWHGVDTQNLSPTQSERRKSQFCHSEYSTKNPLFLLDSTLNKLSHEQRSAVDPHRHELWRKCRE